MPLTYVDRVRDSTTTTGTGNVTLSGSAPAGFLSFNSGYGTTTSFEYVISSVGGSEWEVGTGHLSASTTLVRDSVVASSNANALVNFSAGTKDVRGTVSGPSLTSLATIPRGRQAASTASATPSIAMTAGVRDLLITLGVDSTKISITGLDLDADGGYEFIVVAAGAGATVYLNPNGSTATAGVVYGIFNGGAVALTRLMLLEALAVANVGTTKAVIDGPTGTVKFWECKMRTAQPTVYLETYSGYWNLTANVTSFDIDGALKTGTTIRVRRKS